MIDCYIWINSSNSRGDSVQSILPLGEECQRRPYANPLWYKSRCTAKWKRFLKKKEWKSIDKAKQIIKKIINKCTSQKGIKMDRFVIEHTGWLLLVIESIVPCRRWCMTGQPICHSEYQHVHLFLRLEPAGLIRSIYSILCRSPTGTIRLSFGSRRSPYRTAWLANRQ